MNVRDRILCTFRGEIPDRVPTFVQQILQEFRIKIQHIQIPSKYMVKTEDFDFSYHLFFGFESGFCGGDSALMPNYDDLIVKDFGDGRFLDFYGRIMKVDFYNGIKNVWYMEGTIKNEEDWNSWQYLYPRNLSNKYFIQLNDLYDQGNMKGFLPIPICQGLFAKTTEIMTLDRFAYHSIKNPQFLIKVLDKMLECKLDIIEQYHKHQVPLFGVADDVAFKENTFISPKLYEKYFVPRLKILTDYAHQFDIVTFMHSDGDITPFMPLIIQAGFDGIECLEVAAGVDIFELKERYGNKITLMGNLDVSYLLPYGTVQQVQDQTKKLLLKLKKNGRYIFCPCADIHKEVNYENLKAIKPILEEYGSY